MVETTEMPAEIRSWLHAFRVNSQERGPTDVVHTLVQLGVDDPDGSCNCCLPDELDDPALGWIHANHRAYNNAVWEILAAKPGLMRRLRPVLLRDLRSPDKDFGDGEAYGRIVRKEYARALLNNFLTAKSKWC